MVPGLRGRSAIPHGAPALNHAPSPACPPLLIVRVPTWRWEPLRTRSGHPLAALPAACSSPWTTWARHHDEAQSTAVTESTVRCSASAARTAEPRRVGRVSVKPPSVRAVPSVPASRRSNIVAGSAPAADRGRQTNAVTLDAKSNPPSTDPADRLEACWPIPRPGGCVVHSCPVAAPEAGLPGAWPPTSCVRFARVAYSAPDSSRSPRAWDVDLSYGSALLAIL